MAMSIVAVTISDRLHVLTHKLLRSKRSITAWIIFRCSTAFSAPFMDAYPIQFGEIVRIVFVTDCR